MNYLQNLHTHTTRCDGINTPSELLDIAITKGFDSIGFSGHSANKHSKAYTHITPETTRAYKEEITRLKKEYEGRIKVYLGLEFEMLSDDDLSGLDYTIGSVHYLDTGRGIVGFDGSPETFKNVINGCFGGDGMAFVKSYYDHVSRLPEYYDFDIVGHFDLCYKHGKNAVFYDVDSKEYKNAAIGAIEALAGKIPYFEVNTGCMPRGYKDVPYPLPFIIKEMKRCGFGAVITSDCHNAEYLDYGFAEACRLLGDCGYNETFILTDSGFKPIEI